MIDNAHGTLDSIYKALSKMISTFHIDIEGFCKSLKRQHIISTHENYNTIAATSLRAGIDRRIVAKILSEDPIYHKPAFLRLILNNIEELAINNNMMVKKQGIDSVESVMHDIASGATTLKTIINLLKQSKCIEEHQHHIIFIANRLNMTEHRRLILQQFSTEFLQWVEHILVDYNHDNP